MDYTIERVIEEPGFEGDTPIAHMRVQFKVGGDGPFFERFRKEDFTPSAVEDKLSTFARDLKRMRGTS